MQAQAIVAWATPEWQYTDLSDPRCLFDWLKAWRWILTPVPFNVWWANEGIVELQIYSLQQTCNLISHAQRHDSIVLGQWFCWKISCCSNIVPRHACTACLMDASSALISLMLYLSFGSLPSSIIARRFSCLWSDMQSSLRSFASSISFFCALLISDNIWD